MVSIVYNSVMDMPAFYTTMRGRGGFGASNQKLVDIFWVMTSNNANSPGIQALLKFYVIVKTAITDANMKVSYGFPLNVFQAAANKMTANVGDHVLSVGMKLYIAPAAVPVAKYFGFYAMRMTPFFKATGGNQIDVVVNTERAVKCWSWGSYNGAGWAMKHDDTGITNWFAGKYRPLWQYKQMNMVVCEIGTTAGTATTGDVVIIPATQTAADNPSTVRNPLPAYKTATSTLYSVATQADMLTCTSTNKGPAIIAGSDEYLGTMTHISDGTAINYNTRLTTTAATAGDNAGGTVDKNAVPYFWANGSTLNDNVSARLFDIVAKTSASTNWMIGTEKVDALLEFKLAAAADWTNPRSVAAVCSNTVGAAIPATVAMTSGSSGTGTACTAAYNWVPYAADFNVVTGYSTRTTRMCRFCDAAFSSPKV